MTYAKPPSGTPTPKPMMWAARGTTTRAACHTVRRVRARLHQCCHHRCLLRAIHQATSRGQALRHRLFIKNTSLLSQRLAQL